MLDQVLKQFRLEVVTVNEVEDSFSSTVYKCTLLSGETVFVKIPYTRVKYERELAAYEILAGYVPIPKLLDFWAGDAKCPGALLLSELKGKPLSATASPKLLIKSVQCKRLCIKSSLRTRQDPASYKMNSPIGMILSKGSFTASRKMQK
ncbi:hypothetical protein [Planococcus sp. CP5-4]|uniref:hypothetical protein n=1 Tax=unclassified Planococcus (in: firmicutes) TaxID=2662419 RepID=UPI0027E59F8B|nr:hypothetical protein [Planococcus sp. CP5-4]